jgi:hypothetical protein
MSAASGYLSVQVQLPSSPAWKPTRSMMIIDWRAAMNAMLYCLSLLHKRPGRTRGGLMRWVSNTMRLGRLKEMNLAEKCSSSGGDLICRAQKTLKATPAQADTHDEPDSKLLSFPDVGMRSNRKAESQRVALARQMFQDRRTRPQIFGDTAMFGEGAWDILLALYVAEHSEDYATGAHSMLAAEHPFSTTVRWMSYLESIGLVANSADEPQMTMKTIRLLPKARAMLNTYFDQVRHNRVKGPSR